MFDFLKKTAASNPLEQFKEHLKQLGYEATDYGLKLAQQQLDESVEPLLLAIRFAYTTMAYDLQQSGAAATAVLRFRPQATDILKVLEEYKQHELLTIRQWQEFQDTIVAISAINEHQEAKVKQVLADTEFGSQRLARNTRV